MPRALGAARAHRDIHALAAQFGARPDRLGGRTTMTRAAASGATVRTVLRKSVTPRIPAKAFGLPSRAEKPADRTTRRTPATAFVGIISP